MPTRPRCNVLLLNDDKTPMEFVVVVLERFFGMSNLEARTHVLRIDTDGKAICGTYWCDEVKKKVADVLAFARKHKHPLQCVSERVD